MSAELAAKCACGEMTLRIKPTTMEILTVADCHCSRCRKYHVSAFASYLTVPKESVTVEGSALFTFVDECNELGTVERVSCGRCATKLAATQADTYHVCMGSLDEDTIPKEYSSKWQTSRQGWQLEAKPRWLSARPLAKRNMPPLVVTGGCACGACTYSVDYQPPSELQHCYCKLCRQMSGSAFQTWIPVHVDNFSWTSVEPKLVRTTDHGQRHICCKCAGVLTIIYDDQADTVWPAAGGVDDASLPEDINAYMGRVFHICCIWKQDWYKLPVDGLNRVDYYDININWQEKHIWISIQATREVVKSKARKCSTPTMYIYLLQWMVCLLQSWIHFQAKYKSENNRDKNRAARNPLVVKLRRLPGSLIMEDRFFAALKSNPTLASIRNFYPDPWSDINIPCRRFYLLWCSICLLTTKLIVNACVLHSKVQEEIQPGTWRWCLQRRYCDCNVSAKHCANTAKNTFPSLLPSKYDSMLLSRKLSVVGTPVYMSALLSRTSATLIV